jgi:[ribosomal protein S5]-alanine N-acetyltransferase
MAERRAPERITTARLWGRRPARADIDYVRAVGSDWEIQKTLFERLWPEAECIERLERWMRSWEEHGFGFWIFENAAGEIVGHGGLFMEPEAPGEVSVGYIVRPQFSGNGFATEMVRAAVDIAARDLGLERLMANTMPENAASQRVLEKCGFRFARRTMYAGQYPNAEYRLSGLGKARRELVADTLDAEHDAAGEVF